MFYRDVQRIQPPAEYDRGMVGVTVDRLEEADLQLDLWRGEVGPADGRADGRSQHTGTLPDWEPTARPPAGPSARLQHAIDRIRTRYGICFITVARLLVGSPARCLAHST